MGGDVDSHGVDEMHSGRRVVLQKKLMKVSVLLITGIKMTPWTVVSGSESRRDELRRR